MKKIIVLAAIIPFVFTGCFSFGGSSNEVKELKEQVAQLQKDVAELQKANGNSIAHKAEATSDNEVSGKNEANTTKEQKAVEAIKYCLKKYVSDLKYKNITSVPKSDGTVDVIIDFVEYRDTRHTYYNVAVYNNGEYCVKDISGHYAGNFPYGDKFSIE